MRVDECPFCYIERNVEQDLMDFVLGSCASYMESDAGGYRPGRNFAARNMKKKCSINGNTLGKWMDFKNLL